MRALGCLALLFVVHGCCSPKRAMVGHAMPMWLTQIPGAQDVDVLFAAKDCEAGMEFWRYGRRDNRQGDQR